MVEERQFSDIEMNSNEIKKYASRGRILEIFMQMLQGGGINYKQASEHYGYSEKPITIDMKIIKFMLKKYMPDSHIDFDPNGSLHRINGQGQIKAEEITAILKILIGTRAFSKAELTTLEQDLIQCAPSDERRRIERLSSATLSKYLPVKKTSSIELLELIKQFSNYILDKKVIDFTYGSSTGSDPQELRTGVPLNLYFDTFYFYVTVYMIDKDKAYNYRLDRFQTVTGRHGSYNVPADKKEDEAAAINKTNLLKMGNDVHYKFRYWNFPQTALDRFPGSKVTKQFDDGSVIIEGEIYAEGAKLFILSQGNKIKVMEPISLVEQVKAEHQKALDLYK